MNQQTVKTISKFLQGLQQAADITDKQYKNVRKNVKRIVAKRMQKNAQVVDVLGNIDINRLIVKAKWYN